MTGDDEYDVVHVTMKQLKPPDLENIFTNRCSAVGSPGYFETPLVTLYEGGAAYSNAGRSKTNARPTRADQLTNSSADSVAKSGTELIPVTYRCGTLPLHCLLAGIFGLGQP